MELIREVKSRKSHKGKYEVGCVYLPKEWINKTVIVRENQSKKVNKE